MNLSFRGWGGGGMHPPNPPDPLPPIPLLLPLMFTRAAEEVTRAYARVCPGVATPLKCRVHSIDEIIVKKSGEHSHPQEFGKEEVAVIKDIIRKRGRESNDNPHVAIGQIASSLSESAMSLLPTQHALKTMYKRQRIAPPNPATLEELELYTDKIKTFSNRNFLFYDSGTGPNRIVMFATEENIEFLSM